MLDISVSTCICGKWHLLTLPQPRCIILVKDSPTNDIRLTGFSLARGFGCRSPLPSDQFDRVGFTAPEMIAVGYYKTTRLDALKKINRALAAQITTLARIAPGYYEDADAWSLGVILFNMLMGKLQHVCKHLSLIMNRRKSSLFRRLRGRLYGA